jgi:ABC-2 type transport system permease protein
VARQFARLKLRLVRNGLRAPQYAVLFSLGATGAGLLALAGFSTLALLRHDAHAADTTIVIFAAVTLVWTVVPLLGFGTDETLDPQRLALLPLTPAQLLRGLLVAALVGVAPIATLFALSGAIVGMASGVLSALLIAVAVVATLLLCVVASRTLIAVLAPLLRSRRGRDLLVMTITLGVFVPQSFRLLSARSGGDSVHVISEIADRVRYTPFGWGGLAVTEAGQGHVAAALAALAAVVLVVAILLWIWMRVIPRALTTADAVAPAKTRSNRRGTLIPALFPFLSRNRTGAMTAKDLRYYVRDPRRRGPLIAALIVPGLFLFGTLRNANARPASATLLALVALLPASGLTLNQFGLDGAALWTLVVSGNNARADIVGKNLATVVLVAPLVAIPALATAAVTHGWAYVPLTIGLAPGMLGVILAVGNIVSVYAPYALPDRRNPLAANPGQGCVGGLAALGALFVDTLILVPAGIVAAVALHLFSLPLASVIAIAFATAYGFAVWSLGSGVAVRRAQWRMPELLEAVSPRQAG